MAAVATGMVIDQAEAGETQADHRVLDFSIVRRGSLALYGAAAEPRSTS
jgi:hypothetical protein